MGRIFDTQDYLTIKLAFTEDIAADIASAVIKYVDPDGSEGQWTAAIDVGNKIIYYAVPQGSALGTAGKWTIWSVATMNDGRILVGEPAKFKIFTEGT